MKKYQLIIGMVLAVTIVFADEPTIKPTIQPYLNIQFWNLYSEGITVSGETAPDRAVSYFRRGRAGLKGKLMDQLSYNLMVSFDYLGKDPNLSSKGKVNTGDFSIWSAYATYQVFPKSQWLMITGGTFLPHMSRESVTSPWTTSSLDKGETSCYLRQFATGKTNGICPGINIGGLGAVGKNQLLYNVAYVNRQDATSIITEKWSPVMLGHLIFNIGDKEWSSYKYTLSGNSLKKQKLLSLGVGASTQGETDAFKSSDTYGADLLFCRNGFKLDGEYYFLKRKNTDDYLATCLQIRASYNFFLKKDWILEPAFMLNQFKGDDSYKDASFCDGEDKIIDAGLNLISGKRKMKIGLHYINRSGNGNKNYRITSSGTYNNYLNLGIQLMI